MSSENDNSEDIKARNLAYEVMFQSIFYSLDVETKAKAVKTIEDNFAGFEKNPSNSKTLLEKAKVIAARTSGAKL
ncbi:MAG: hypothetical protein [Bacteriophage sp.]|nr:MAG: hypothetical protein [Bacteriophage sp.]